MQLKKALSVLAAVILSILAFGLYIAQANTPERAIPATDATSPSAGAIHVTWETPSDTDTLNSYRVSWGLWANGWTSYRVPNSDTGGNAYPDAPASSYTITGLAPGEYVVAVRARYDDFQNGAFTASGKVTVAGDSPPRPTPASTPEATPEATPQPTPEPTPEATPEAATPEPTPEATPEPALLSSRTMTVKDVAAGGPVPYVGHRLGGSGSDPHLLQFRYPESTAHPEGQLMSITGLLHAGDESPLYLIVAYRTEQDSTLLLRIDGQDFAMTDATLLEGGKRGQVYFWTGHGLSWQVGDTVGLEVYYRSAPAVELPRQQLANAVRDLEMTSTEEGFLDLSWRDSENAGDAGVDAYEVYVKAVDQAWSEARREIVPRTYGRASTGNGSGGNPGNNGAGPRDGGGTAKMSGTPGGWDGLGDHDRQLLLGGNTPAQRSQGNQETRDTGGDSEAEEETQEFKLSVLAPQGGVHEARVYPRAGNLRGNGVRSDQVNVDPLVQLASSTPEGNVLVSNLRYPALDAGYASAGVQTITHAFTTGPRDGGYDIAKIRMRIRTSDGDSPQVSIHSDSGGRPGASRHVLNPPENASTGLNVVDFAGTDVKLDADTTYWLTYQEHPTNGDSSEVLVTAFTGEDGGEDTGWSISNDAYLRIRIDGEQRTYYFGRVRATVGGVPLMEFVEKRSSSNSAPAITTAANLTVGENVAEVASLLATDEYIPTGGLAWSIRFGADGLLLFRTPKDFEATKDDANGDGVYELSVQVSDGTLTTTK